MHCILRLIVLIPNTTYVYRYPVNYFSNKKNIHDSHSQSNQWQLVLSRGDLGLDDQGEYSISSLNSKCTIDMDNVSMHINQSMQQ